MWPNFTCLLTALEPKWLQMVSSQQLVINKEPVLSAGTLSSNTAPFYAAKCPGRHKKGERKNQKWSPEIPGPLEQRRLLTKDRGKRWKSNLQKVWVFWKKRHSSWPRERFAGDLRCLGQVPKTAAWGWCLGLYVFSSQTKRHPWL